jgi:hypothetical protein
MAHAALEIVGELDTAFGEATLTESKDSTSYRVGHPRNNALIKAEQLNEGTTINAKEYKYHETHDKS